MKDVSDRYYIIKDGNTYLNTQLGWVSYRGHATLFPFDEVFSSHVPDTKTGNLPRYVEVDIKGKVVKYKETDRPDSEKWYCIVSEGLYWNEGLGWQPHPGCCTPFPSKMHELPSDRKWVEITWLFNI